MLEAEGELGLLLSEHAEAADRSMQWPTASWEALRRHGVLRNSLPPRWGGVGSSSVELLRTSEFLAAHCLTTAFILSQREAAVRHLLRGPDHLQERFLTPTADGSQVLTVGLSQLTTSRQHGVPALLAVSDANGYRLDGFIPWVTAADRADAIVAGASLADGNQILFTLPPHRHGVTIDPPMDLAALAGSRTAQVRCERVRIEPEEILADPKPQVLGAVGGGGLETSCLALGVGRAALDLLRPEADRRSEVREVIAAFDPVMLRLRERLHTIALAATVDPALTLTLRTDTSLFALRTSQTALLLAKGVGFVTPHPAQRLARQALFFLVWSCPRPVAEGVRSALLGSNPS